MPMIDDKNRLHRSMSVSGKAKTATRSAEHFNDIRKPKAIGHTGRPYPLPAASKSSPDAQASRAGVFLAGCADIVHLMGPPSFMGSPKTDGAPRGRTICDFTIAEVSG